MAEVLLVLAVLGVVALVAVVLLRPARPKEDHAGGFEQVTDVPDDPARRPHPHAGSPLSQQFDDPR